jgi:predicted ATPase
LSHAATALWFLGFPDQALKKATDAMTLARELSHPYSLAFALACFARIHQYRRELGLAEESAEALISLSSERGFERYIANGTLLRGWALAAQGKAEREISETRQGLDTRSLIGLRRAFHLSLLADAYGKCGQVAQGLDVLAEAMDLIEKSGSRRWEPELYRLRGELLLKQGGDEAQVENDFLHVLEVARRQEAKSLELRAATSMARLWQGQGKRDEARELLSGIYGWFTEGFDTADLQDAKALLEKLS